MKGRNVAIAALMVVIAIFFAWVIWNLPGWLDYHIAGWGFAIGVVIDIFLLLVLIALEFALFILTKI